jgi:hypothetical protein
MMNKGKLWFGRAVRFSQETDDKLVQAAKEQGVTISELIRRACAAYLTKKKGAAR